MQGALLAITLTRWRKAVRQGNCPVRVSWPARRLPTTPGTRLPSPDTAGRRELAEMSRVEGWESTLARICTLMEDLYLRAIRLTAIRNHRLQRLSTQWEEVPASRKEWLKGFQPLC